MTVRYVQPNYQAPDLPITSASICTLCGQLLHPSDEGIGLRPETEFEFEPGYEPVPEEELDFETWQNLPGTWIHYCPRCYCLFSKKPPRPVVIIDADTYPQIEDLMKKYTRVQETLRIHESTLDLIEQRIATYTELEAPIHLIHQRDEVKELISTVTKELRAIDQKIRHKVDILIRRTL